VITTIAIGATAFLEAFVHNPTSNKVYCTLGRVGFGEVAVIDGATDSVIKTITVGTWPQALVHNPTNNKVYCANKGNPYYPPDSTVTVIDGAADSVITTIMVGYLPYALVHDPTNNKVYCANWIDDNVTVIDGASDSVITTIMVGSRPCAFAWNPVQNRTYVANHFGASVSVIRDSMTGVEESKVSIVNTKHIGATIFRGPLQLPEGKKCKVFNITGRVVAPDKVQPGIYFVEVEGVVTQKVVKIR
jgi:YVTN family beta-propeller protein